MFKASHRKKIFIFLALILLIVFNLSCKEEKTKKVSKVKKIIKKKGGIFNYYLVEPVSIDPLNAQESEGIEVAKQLFDGLIDYDPKTSEIKPAVADSWEANKDASVFTFKIRKGVKFHNGREVVADDFKYAWERVAKKDSGSDVSYHLAPIKGFDEMQEGKTDTLEGIKVKDKYTLEITLSYPYADFTSTLGHPIFSPVPKEEVEKDPKAFSEKPIGNGPFEMIEPWQHNQSIMVKRFKNYYGEKSLLDQVNFKIFENENTAYLEFKAGNLDYTYIPEGQIKAVQSEYGKSAIVGKPQLILYYYVFNMDKEPFKNNSDLRKAINYAIDRKAIADTIYEGTRAPALGIIPPGIEGYKKSKISYSYNLTKAKESLKKAGYENGQGLPTLKLSFNSGKGHEGPAQAVQANLKSIGINIELESMEWGAFIDAAQKGELALFRFGWAADYPIMDNFLYPLFYSKNIGKDNTSNYNNPKIDELLIEARKTLNKEKRLELYRNAENKILDDSPVVPIVFYASRVVFGKNVKDFIRTPMDDTPLNLVWLEEKQ